MKRNRCVPKCSVNTTNIRPVIYRNGTIHAQKYCLICERISYVPKYLIPSNIPPVLLSSLKKNLSPKDRNGLGEGLFGSDMSSQVNE